MKVPKDLRHARRACFFPRMIAPGWPFTSYASSTAPIWANGGLEAR